MNCQLWVREVYAQTVELVVYLFVCFKVDVPVVLALHPNAYCHVHATVGQTSKYNYGCRFLQYPFVHGENVAQRFAHLVNILAILHSNGKVNASQRFLAVVCDIAA